jgi:hypothetical protein
MRYPIEKYHFKVNGNKVYASSTYAGKKVEAHASCAPEDDFDIETGKKLAAYRCNVRVAKRRMQRAEAKTKEYYDTLQIILNDYKKTLNYVKDTHAEYAQAVKELTDLERSLKLSK